MFSFLAPKLALILNSVIKQLRPRKMSESLLKPPVSVANMTDLDYNLFRKQINVPYIIVDEKIIQDIARYLKPVYLTVRGIDTIQNLPDQVNGGNKEEETGVKKMILLNPDIVKSLDDLDEKTRKILAEKIRDCQLYSKKIELNFNNYDIRDIMNSIFPKEDQRVRSWSIIGHIIHVNLREEKLPFKHLIGQILLETNPVVKMVINKSEIIDTKFRNFAHEVIAIRPDADPNDTIVKVHSNNCVFQFDFAKVYWNPRLNTEHSRFLNRLDKGRDVVYDMFAGIGPFAIPAAKKKCRVLANDLNPDAYHWLQINSKTNKVDNHLTAYNMDAREFVRSVIKKDLLESWDSDDVKDYVVKPTFHVLMNLPGMAIEFLDSFVGLLSDQDEEKIKPLIIPPLIHCYTFLKQDRNPIEAIAELVEETISAKLPENYELKMVRTVAPFKSMYRITFNLPIEVLFNRKVNKKQRTS